jgi:threonyl-tRNA synthetase
MSEQNLETMRHSLSHILAAAVIEMFPEAKLAIGPAVENGFYYDFDLPRTLIPEDLALLEERMIKIIKADYPFERAEVPAEEALKQAKKSNQIYKADLIEELIKEGTKTVSFYRVNSFTDLCRGPHVKSTKEVGAFKLTSIAGAYWRGDEKNKMLQRIYGVAFKDKKDLDNYLEMLAEAEKRDHRKLGKELGLFVFSDLVGPGLPLFTNRGTVILQEIVKYSSELQKTIGYQEVHTPNINKAELFKVSGHYEKYQDSMFKVISNYSKEEYFLKPMNCPQHTQLYAAEKRSYRDLPIRIADFANLYRDEKPGELNGLTRLRCFRQDDGHVFCREDQIKEEFKNVLGIIEKALKTYGMKYEIRLSLWDPKHPESYLGDPKTWEKSQKILKDILKDNKVKSYEAVGEAAIYGPKMDLISKDSVGREWQISTIQLDFIMPKRFDLKYVDNDGKEKTPVMIHRAIVGSPERFLGILIEHYAGVFPTWLAPVQVQLIPVSDKFIDFAKTTAKKFSNANIRVNIDETTESVGKKIRNAELLKIPYMIVVGEKEEKSGLLPIRSYKDGDLGNIKPETFVESLTKEIIERA